VTISHTTDLDVPEDTAWAADAVCAHVVRPDYDPWYAHPYRDDDLVAEAKAFCAACPVLNPCRAWALSRPQEQGVWGGMTEDERTQHRKAVHRRNSRRKVSA